MATLKRGVVSDVLTMPAYAGAEKEFEGGSAAMKYPASPVIVDR